MNLIHLAGFDPALHLATEEYLLRETTEEYLLLWRSSPSVILGRHQIAGAEVNVPFLHANNIPLLRRISGGGCVFHDPSNLNFAFIQNTASSREIDYTRALTPVLESLTQMGISVVRNDKSDLYLDGKKISGNALYVHRSRVLHHGTLLYDADLALLRNCLKSHPERYITRAIPSRRAPTVNIRSVYPHLPDTASFLEKWATLLADITESTFETLSSEVSAKIAEKYLCKYQDREWNWHSGPRYQFENKAQGIRFSVQDGHISAVENMDTHNFQHLLSHHPFHDYNVLRHGGAIDTLSDLF
jgi:lipoate-protein ligase A